MNDYHFIKDEMLVHVPLCAHAVPRRVLVIGGCDNLRNELAKHSVIEETLHIDAEGAREALEGLGVRKYDVAIVADSRFGTDREFWIELTKHLDEKGLASAVMSNLVTETEAAKAELKLLGGIYRILMPTATKGSEARRVASPTNTCSSPAASTIPRRTSTSSGPTSPTASVTTTATSPSPPSRLRPSSSGSSWRSSNADGFRARRRSHRRDRHGQEHRRFPDGPLWLPPHLALGILVVLPLLGQLLCPK